MARPAVSWLYVPGDRPDRFAKADASGAHVVIVDLEDAVAPARKEQARADAVDWLRQRGTDGLEVRVNPRGTAWFAADLAVLAALDRPPTVRLPKTISADDITAVRDVLPGAAVTALIESALGVENAYAVACADGVTAIGLGEADLSGELGIDDEGGLTYARSRLVVAAAAAGLPAPAMSVYPHVRDTGGLAASCRRGRALGFVGRAAIHPSQLAVIHDAFRPSAVEQQQARDTLTALAVGDGVTTTADGRMVDAAMRRRAEHVLALAERLGG